MRRAVALSRLLLMAEWGLRQPGLRMGNTLDFWVGIYYRAKRVYIIQVSHADDHCGVSDVPAYTEQIDAVYNRCNPSWKVRGRPSLMPESRVPTKCRRGRHCKLHRRSYCTGLWQSKMGRDVERRQWERETCSKALRRLQTSPSISQRDQGLRSCGSHLV